MLRRLRGPLPRPARGDKPQHSTQPPLGAGQAPRQALPPTPGAGQQEGRPQGQLQGGGLERGASCDAAAAGGSGGSLPVYGSVFVPTPGFLARLRFRPWAGVHLSDEYLRGVAGAEAATRRLLAAYAEHGVVPLVESEIKRCAGGACPFQRSGSRRVPRWGLPWAALLAAWGVRPVCLWKQAGGGRRQEMVCACDTPRATPPLLVSCPPCQLCLYQGQ
jgi:hypothetical protein